VKPGAALLGFLAGLAASGIVRETAGSFWAWMLTLAVAALVVLITLAGMHVGRRKAP
jgi:hypothetical protein